LSSDDERKKWKTTTCATGIVLILCLVIVSSSIGNTSDKIQNEALDKVQQSLNETNSDKKPFDFILATGIIGSVMSTIGTLYSAYKWVKS